MGWPQPRPEVVEQALGWLRAQDPSLRLDRLADDLKRAGYDDASVQVAISRRQEELDAAVPATADLRGKVATVLIVGFLLGWAVPTVLMLQIPDDAYLLGDSSVVVLMSVILAVLLAPVGIVAVILARRSKSLRRGSGGMAAALLVIPFIWLVIVAGSCATMVTSSYTS